MLGRPSIALFVTVLAFALSLASANPAIAKGGGGGHKGPAPSGSLTLVLLNSTDGQPHWGQQVTFTVSTTATSEPHVNVDCSQSGVVVYGTTTGYYASYPWPWTQVTTLSSADWSSGSADCVAVLWYASGAKMDTLGTMSFHVSD